MTFEKKKAWASPHALCQDRCPEQFIPGDGFQESLKKPSLLLHSCCGPCSTAVVEQLTDEFDVTVFFYNPCITDEKEYQKRREAQLHFIRRYNEENMGTVRIHFKEGEYRPGEFLKMTADLAEEPEGGARCRACFRQRLEKTAETAKLTGYDCFATTLTVSPHKNYGIISDIGRKLALKYCLTYIDRDFKKKDGFKRSIELSKKYGLYRQDYCGCKYSKKSGEE